MKYLKRILLAAGAFIFVLVSALSILCYNLDTLATPKILSSLQEKWLPEVKINWDKVSVEITNQSFYKKTLDLKTTEATCLQWKKSQFCLQEFHVIIAITLNPKFDYKLKKVQIVSDKSKIHLDDIITKSPDAMVFNINNTLLKFQSYLSFILSNRPDQFNINIQNSQLKTKNITHNLNLSLSSQKILLHYSESNTELSLKGDVLELNTDHITLKLKALLNLKKYKVETQFSLSLQTNGKSQIDLQAYDRSANQGIPSFQYLKSKLNLQINSDGSQLNIQEIAFKPNYGFEDLVGKFCAVSFYSRETESTQWECKKLHMTQFETKEIIKIKQENKAFKNMFSILKIETDGYLNEKNIFAESLEKLAEINLSAESEEQGFLNLNLKTSFEFFQSSKKLSWNIKQLDAEVNVSSFQEIVQKLKESRWAIPMPFNTLDGDVKINIQELSSKETQMHIKGHVKINLKGKGNQSVQLAAKGSYLHSFDVKTKPHFLKANVMLNKVAFHLPPIDPLRGIPPLTDDPRVSSKKVKTQKNTLKYDISIQSSKKDSIQIYYKHFVPFLTASLSADLNTARNIFTFEVYQPFEISYLRREVQINNFKVENNNSDTSKLYVDGHMTYQASDYLIFIDLLGDIERPNVKLSSQPSLPRDDIISLLLYKRTRGTLSSSQRKNVGGTDAALTDRAIGLIGIWAFASTPIESIYYNSQNQSYQAVISLPGEIKMNVGTDWEDSQFVGLKKRLSSRWSLVTGYESGDEQGIGNIFLQREYSY